MSRTGDKVSPRLKTGISPAGSGSSQDARRSEKRINKRNTTRHAQDTDKAQTRQGTVCPVSSGPVTNIVRSRRSWQCVQTRMGAG
eukprot:16436087-Heterocapsa_arctica.AAC.1